MLRGKGFMSNNSLKELRLSNGLTQKDVAKN